jgi:uncharacterized protein YdhG (YjbR/CyaY superfamily)
MNDVDSYIANQKVEHREQLEMLRMIIQTTVPDAEELISYSIPCYKLHGFLVGMGVNKKGCSLYALNNKLQEKLKDEIVKYKVSGGTIHFPMNEKLPVTLIRKIIKIRLKENKAREKAKLQKKK